MVKKKKAAEVVKPKVEKKAEPAAPKENVTKSLVSQLKTETISIAQQNPNTTQNVTSNLVETSPGHSQEKVLAEKVVNHTNPVKNESHNSTTNATLSQKKAGPVPSLSQNSSAVNGTAQAASLRKVQDKSEQKPPEHAKIQTEVKHLK